jgi:hypothetical protein
MFLFTSNNAPQPLAAGSGVEPVSRALETAATESGVSFDYLLRTAKRESSLNPAAEARSSSASGLFQFVEQTWLGLVKTDGHKVGLTNAAAYITESSPGRYTVADPAARQAILDMRKDPDLSARIAGIFTTRNREQLTRSIGRPPNAGELYIAHFLGASGGSDLIRMAATNPDASAASAFPDAAAANRSIFYNNGQERTAGEVYASLVAKHSGAAPAPSAAFQAYAGEGGVNMDSNGAWSGFHNKPAQRGGLFDLFRSDGAPVSENVERVWTRRPIDEEQSGAFALRPALSSEGEAALGAPVSLQPPESRPVQPRKPKPMADDDGEPRGRQSSIGEPIDLMKFMRVKG